MIAVMGRGSVRGWWFIGLGLVLVGGPVLWVYCLPPASRRDAVSYGQFVLAVVGLVIAVLGWFQSIRPTGPRPVGMLADLLALEVGRQWRQEAAERILVRPAPIPVSWSLRNLVRGTVEAAVGTTGMAPTFPPLPGQTRVTMDQLLAGGGRGELFSVYAGIASGQMVVVGAPGAGKSGTAIMLLLDALNHRDSVDEEDRARVPVPVLLTAHGWDPTSCRPVQDWLAARLAADYSPFQHRGGQVEAASLVATGAVALVLDGLDEMDAAWRPAALRALNCASFRVVVLTRSQEMIQATGAAYLVEAVAVQLHDVAGSQAADYLQRARTEPPPLGWAQLLAHLREHPDSALTRALSTPLTLTLVRDTYRPGDDISELRDDTRFHTADAIRQHLITRVLPAAYTPRPGRPKPRYSLAQAEQALAFLARQMNQDHTRDLVWWHIPGWAPTRARILASMVAGGLLGGLLGGLAYGLTAVVGVMYGDRLWTELGNASLLGLAFGLGFGLPVGLAYGRGDREPKRIRNWRSISLRSVLTTGLATGLVAGLAVMLMNGPAVVLNAVPHHWLVPFMLQLGGGLAVGLLCGLKHDLPGGLGEGSSPQELVKTWGKDRVVGLVAGLVVMVMVVVMVGLSVGLMTGLGLGLVAGLVVVFGFRLMPRIAGGFVAGLAVGSTSGAGSPQGPVESWRNDRVFGLVIGLGLGLGLGLGFGFGNAILAGFKLGFRAGFMTVLGAVISGGLLGLLYAAAYSVSWSTTLAWFQLRLNRQIPAVDLMSFLEDARDRDVLRTVGAAYQFRHATLQDRLAGQPAVTSPAPLTTQIPS
jgi:hypothetical protein